MSYNITKAVENGMTIYKAADASAANNAAICAALTAAANDVWPYVHIAPGNYTAAQLCRTGKNALCFWIDDNELPADLRRIEVACGPARCAVGDVRNNIVTMFTILNRFETMAKTKNAVFTKAAEMGDVLATVRFTVPKDIKKIIAHAEKKDSFRPVMESPCIDLQKKTLVASDGKTLAVRRVELSVEADSNVPDLQPMPREIVDMAGMAVTARIEKGGRTCVTADNGMSCVLDNQSRYPNWRSVLPTEASKPKAVDVAALKKAIKVVSTGTNETAFRIYAEEGDTMLHLECGDKTTILPAGWTSPGFDITLDIKNTKKTLAMNPTSVRFQDRERCLVWENADTIILQMPRRPLGDNSNKWDGEVENYSVSWLSDTSAKTKTTQPATATQPTAKATQPATASATPAQPVQPAAPKHKRGRKPMLKATIAEAAPASTPEPANIQPAVTPSAEVCQPVPPAEPQSLADRLRAALRARLAQAA